jgi:hypothetical protein
MDESYPDLEFNYLVVLVAWGVKFSKTWPCPVSKIFML